MDDYYTEAYQATADDAAQAGMEGALAMWVEEGSLTEAQADEAFRYLCKHGQLPKDLPFA